MFTLYRHKSIYFDILEDVAYIQNCLGLIYIFMQSWKDGCNYMSAVIYF